MWIERNEMERCYKLFERARSVDDRNEEIIKKREMYTSECI